MACWKQSFKRRRSVWFRRCVKHLLAGVLRKAISSELVDYTREALWYQTRGADGKHRPPKPTQEVNVPHQKPWWFTHITPSSPNLPPPFISAIFPNPQNTLISFCKKCCRLRMSPAGPHRHQVVLITKPQAGIQGKPGILLIQPWHCPISMCQVTRLSDITHYFNYIALCNLQIP